MLMRGEDINEEREAWSAWEKRNQEMFNTSGKQFLF